MTNGFVFDLVFVVPLFIIGVAAWIRVEKRCDRREAAEREPYAVVNDGAGFLVITADGVELPIRAGWTVADVLDTVLDIETFNGIEAAR